MSALGQKQTFAPQNGMSALPPEATAKADLRHVCFTPESGHVQRDSVCRLWARSGHSVGLLDHLVGASYKCVGHCEAKCFGSLKVDNEFDFGGLLDR